MGEAKCEKLTWMYTYDEAMEGFKACDSVRDGTNRLGVLHDPYLTIYDHPAFSTASAEVHAQKSTPEQSIIQDQAPVFQLFGRADRLVFRCAHS